MVTFKRPVRAWCIGVAMLALTAGGAHAEVPKATPVPGEPALPLAQYDLKALGYTVEEFFISGTATSYKFAEPPHEDGKWKVTAAETAPYTTRIVVVRPTDPKKFNGGAMVEWLNVSGGTDMAADWFMAHREMIRSGQAYVGVSAQKVAVEGGGGIMGADGRALKQTNPERYGKLSHPGDAYSFDIFTQVGKLLKDPEAKLLGSVVAKRLIAAGESQSAVYLTTYVNAIDPVAKTYDGFLIHSRFGSAAGLGNGGLMAASEIPRSGVKFRADQRVPNITIITETDLVGGGLSGFYASRQPDDAHLRTWEIAGAAHADNYARTVGLLDSGAAPMAKVLAAYAPTTTVAPGLQVPNLMNNAPQHHYVVEAAVHDLDAWIKSGKAPPKAPLLKTTEDGKNFAADANGLAEGGIRSPWVDVPTSRLSGLATGSAIAALMGTVAPFDAAKLKQLYPGGKPDYLKKFGAALDSTIKAGFILPADRKEILDLADASYPAP